MICETYLKPMRYIETEGHGYHKCVLHDRDKYRRIRRVALLQAVAVVVLVPVEQKQQYS